MKQAYVICLNDSVEAVVIGSKKQADKKKDELKAAYMKKNYYYLKGRELEEMGKCIYFHLHTVDVFYLNNKKGRVVNGTGN